LVLARTTARLIYISFGNPAPLREFGAVESARDCASARNFPVARIAVVMREAPRRADG